MVSTEDKNSSAPSPAKERDEEIDKIRESMRAEYEARRRKDEESARARGARVVQLVEAELSHVAQMMEKPLTMRRRVWSTEEQLAARRAEMANAAEATKRQHARKRHANPEALEGATREQCAAEYGPIMGFPYRPEDEAAFKPLAEIVAPGEVKARAIYTQLRKAITEARDLAFRLPGGSGGAAGRALFYMRGILPVLPGLNEPPFNKHVRPGRAAFVHEREELFRHVQKRTPSSRDLAVLCLLHGFCPGGGYKTLLRGAKGPKGLTVAEVIERETRCVERVRKERSTPT